MPSSATLSAQPSLSRGAPLWPGLPVALSLFALTASGIGASNALGGDVCNGDAERITARYPVLTRVVQRHDLERQVASLEIEADRAKQMIEALAEDRAPSPGADDVVSALIALAERQRTELLSACRAMR